MTDSLSYDNTLADDAKESAESLLRSLSTTFHHVKKDQTDGGETNRQRRI